MRRSCSYFLTACRCQQLSSQNVYEADVPAKQEVRDCDKALSLGLPATSLSVCHTLAGIGTSCQRCARKWHRRREGLRQLPTDSGSNYTRRCVITYLPNGVGPFSVNSEPFATSESLSCIDSLILKCSCFLDCLLALKSPILRCSCCLDCLLALKSPHPKVLLLSWLPFGPQIKQSQVGGLESRASCICLDGGHFQSEVNWMNYCYKRKMIKLTFYALPVGKIWCQVWKFHKTTQLRYCTSNSLQTWATIECQKQWQSRT